MREIIRDIEKLHTKSESIEVYDESLVQLLDEMLTVVSSNVGQGISAIQLGIPQRVFLVLIDGIYKEFINPEIVKVEGEQISRESCMSVKGKTGELTRPETVIVRARDRDGKIFTSKYTGLEARCICHELDHLDGKLYIDVEGVVVKNTPFIETLYRKLLKIKKGIKA